MQYCFLSLLAQFTLLQFAHSNERNPFTFCHSQKKLNFGKIGKKTFLKTNIFEKTQLNGYCFLQGTYMEFKIKTTLDGIFNV